MAEFLREPMGVLGRELRVGLVLNSSELRLSEPSLKPLLMELLSLDGCCTILSKKFRGRGLRNEVMYCGTLEDSGWSSGWVPEWVTLNPGGIEGWTDDFYPEFNTSPLRADLALNYFIPSQNQEPDWRNQEPGTRLEEPDWRNQEPGTRLEEPDWRNQEPGTRLEEPGTRLHTQNDHINYLMKANLVIVIIVIIVVIFIVHIWTLSAEVAVSEVISLQKGRIGAVQRFDELDTSGVADPEGNVQLAGTCGRGFTGLESGAGLTLAP
ncbi:hypothetical protein EYF80_005607 [Liparis tanakae]|uniref:Uncharacterized protein n=1 Tax=Liparis tanakae TaxID=230148 RepID=A0A4Z2J248_9TELE|nr:hypothetical protein EYF80_005607 [Liparis tanakae]